MTLGSTSRVNMRYVLEQTFGTTPAVALGLPETLRITGESLAYNLGTTSSAELRADRQTLDLAQVSASAGGGINFEMSFNEYDDLMEAALQGTWLGCNDATGITCTITLTNTITASAGTPFANIPVGTVVKFGGFANAANNRPFVVATASSTVITTAATLVNEAGVTPVSFTSYGKVGPNTTTFTTSAGTTITASTGDPFNNVVVGQWIKFSGMATAANNVYAQIVTKTNSKVLVFAAATFSANEANPAAVISSSRLTDGSTMRSFSIEREHADITQFFMFTGMNVAKMNLNMASGSLVSGSFDFMGKAGAAPTGTTGLAGTPNVSTVYDIINAVSGVGNVLEGGAVLSGTYIKSASFGVDNKLRGQSAIGTLGNVGIGNGSVDVKGSIEVYLADGTYYNKFINNTASSLSFRLLDAAGNGYVITFPHVEYSDAKVNAGSKDQDAMLQMPFEALYDTTTGHTILIDKVMA